MSMQHVLDTVRAFDGVHELAPAPGSRFPRIAWGDHFFYYAPDERTPSNTQPYATIVTKDYPGDDASRLDEAGRWRVNIHVGRMRFLELLGEDPRSFGDRDFAVADEILPHPVYGALGWVAVVNPHDLVETVCGLLRDAHDDAARRFSRRQRRGDS